MVKRRKSGVVGLRSLDVGAGTLQNRIVPGCVCGRVWISTDSTGGDRDGFRIQQAVNEKLIEKKLKEAVRRLGGKALKFSSPYETGYPDRIVLMPGGGVYWAELKTTGKKATGKQLLKQSELRALGFVSEVIDSEASLKNFLELIEYERK